MLSRTRASVFALTETWLDESVKDAEVLVPNFSIVRRDRNRSGGGVALYVRSDVAFNQRPDLSVDGLEAVWIELLIPRTKAILVCSCYRPPSDGSFLDKLEQSLAKVDPRTETFILGDLNIDVGNHLSSLSRSYSTLLNVFGLSQLIKEPTRITPTTSSFIDHVIVSAKERVRDYGVLCVGLSDHLVTFCSRGIKGGNSGLSNVRRIRSLRN